MVDASALVFSSREKDFDGSDHEDIDNIFMNQSKIVIITHVLGTSDCKLSDRNYSVVRPRARR